MSTDQQNGVVNRAAEYDDINIEDEAGKKDKTGKVDYKVDENEERGNWSGKFDFFLSCVGYAVGLGNVWRFPYLCYENGGGAFLLPYFLMLALVGLPMFFLELVLGQFSNHGPLTLWKISPMFKGIGYAMIIVSIIVSIYYNVIIAWSIYYFFASFTSKLPWDNCNNYFNDALCLMDFSNATSVPCTKNITTNCTRYQVPAEQYFHRVMLGLHSYTGEEAKMSPYMGNIQWHVCLCLLLAWIICTAALIKGVKSSGKVVYFTAVFPYVVIIIMVINGATLKGSLEGIKYYIIPKFDRLKDIKVWGDAATQIFYSLGVGFGGLLTMSSYNRFNNNCLRDAISVSLINCFTSFLAGFAIFSVLGFIAAETHRPVADTAASGSGLAFVVYAHGISKMPGAPFWSLIFFLMLITLGIDSQFGGMEAIYSGIQDEWPWLRRDRKTDVIFKVVTGIGMFFLGLPLVTQHGMYLFTILDNYAGSYSLIIIALSEIIATQYFYGFKNIIKDIEMMLNIKPNYYWLACWIVLTPIITILILVISLKDFARSKYNTYTLPIYADVIGALVALVSILAIPTYFIYYLIRFGFRRSCADDWGPGVKSHWLNDERYACKLPKGFDPASGLTKVDDNVLQITTAQSNDNLGFYPYVDDEKKQESAVDRL